LPTSIEFSASITVPTALGAPRFAQRTAVTIPDTVAVETIAIKAARMTGVMGATRSLRSEIRRLGVVRIEFQKTQRPVQFEITKQTREALLAWIRIANRRSDDYLFPSRLHGSPHLSTRQYARIVGGWVREIGLDSSAYGTHTMRRTKASLIYRRTKNLRVVQLLLGHTKLESTVRYLGIEVDDALEMAEQTEV
jgi:integrase